MHAAFWPDRLKGGAFSESERWERWAMACGNEGTSEDRGGEQRLKSSGGLPERRWSGAVALWLCETKEPERRWLVRWRA